MRWSDLPQIYLHCVIIENGGGYWKAVSSWYRTPQWCIRETPSCIEPTTSRFRSRPLKLLGMCAVTHVSPRFVNSLCRLTIIQWFLVTFISTNEILKLVQRKIILYSWVFSALSVKFRTVHISFYENTIRNWWFEPEDIVWPLIIRFPLLLSSRYGIGTLGKCY